MSIRRDPLALHNPFSFHRSVRFGVNTVVEKKKKLQLVIKNGVTEFVKLQRLQWVSKSDILVSCLKTWQSRKDAWQTQHNMQTLDRTHTHLWPLYALIVMFKIPLLLKTTCCTFCLVFICLLIIIISFFKYWNLYHWEILRSISWHHQLVKRHLKANFSSVTPFLKWQKIPLIKLYRCICCCFHPLAPPTVFSVPSFMSKERFLTGIFHYGLSWALDLILKADYHVCLLQGTRRSPGRCLWGRGAVSDIIASLF